MTEPIRTSVILLASLGLLASACRPSVDYCADYDPHAYLPDEWQVIPPGTFEMGSTDGDEREQPTHFVTVEGFLMWRTEVTVEQYAQCFCAGACEEPYIDATPVVQNWDVPDREQHPVNYATWHHAAAYCEFVEGRLPSEAEWEHAARSGGQPIAYAWGDEWASCGHAVMDEGGPGRGAHRRGLFPAGRQLRPAAVRHARQPVGVGGRRVPRQLQRRAHGRVGLELRGRQHGHRARRQLRGRRRARAARGLPGLGRPGCRHLHRGFSLRPVTLPPSPATALVYPGSVREEGGMAEDKWMTLVNDDLEDIPRKVEALKAAMAAEA